MFKQLTNVRPPASDNPELITTPTSGTLKITGAGASHIAVGNGDYVSVLQDDDKNSDWNGLYLVKGTAGDDKEAQFGSKLATSSGKDTAGSLSFSSENAYKSLGGNKSTNRVFTIGEPRKHPDFTTPLYKLEFKEEVAKQERAKKGSKKAAATS